jgi:hypothetical protein
MVNLKNFLVSLPSVLNSRTTELTRMVEKYPDSTLSEYCEYWQATTKLKRPTMMCREVQKQKLTRKKIIRSSQSATERVQIYMCEFWKKVKNIDPGNLFFFGGNGRFIGFDTHPRSFKGSIVYDLKSFYGGKNYSCRSNK